MVRNALAKMQSQDMEFIFPERAPSIEENGPIIPMWTKMTDAEVVWLRGSVNSGIVYVPDSHPTPLPLLSGFVFGRVLVGLFSRLDGGSALRLRFVAALHAV